MEKRFGRSEHLPEQAEDPGSGPGQALLKLLPLVCHIKDGLANAVKSMAKQAFRGSLMRLERDRFEPMPPSTYMIGPAKRYRQHTT